MLPPPPLPLLQAKAHNVRIVIAWLADKKFLLREKSEYERIRATCCWGIADFFYCMEQFPRYLSDAHVARFIKAGFSVAVAAAAGIAAAATAAAAAAAAADGWQGEAFLSCNVDLCRRAISRGVPLYFVAPKHHPFSHMLAEIQTERANHRFQWCFCDEDFIGRVVMYGKNTPMHVFCI